MGRQLIIVGIEVPFNHNIMGDLFMTWKFPRGISIENIYSFFRVASHDNGTFPFLEHLFAFLKHPFRYTFFGRHFCKMPFEKVLQKRKNAFII